MPLQNEILLYVAENGPTSIRAVSIALGKTYKSTYEAFQSLSGKGLLTNKPSTESYDKWWLSLQGVYLAIGNGAAPRDVVENAEHYFDGDVLEVVKFVGRLAETEGGRKIAKLAYETTTLMNGGGELDVSKWVLTILPALTSDAKDAAVDAVGESPFLQGKVVEVLEKTTDIMKKLKV